MPGRLLLRRLPAGGRDRALLAGDGGGRALRPGGRPRARHLQRLPGPVRGAHAARRAAAATRRCGSCAARWTWSWSTTARRSPARARPARCCRFPVKHTTGCWFAPADQLDALEANGQLVLRYAPGHNPNGSHARRRRRLQRGRQRARPDAASRARDRPAHRLRPTACGCSRALSPVAASSVSGSRSSCRACSPRRGLSASPTTSTTPHRRAARARAERGRAGGVLAAVVRALRVQALEEAARASSRPRASAC